jgi:hypothetical protein
MVHLSDEETVAKMGHPNSRFGAPRLEFSAFAFGSQLSLAGSLLPQFQQDLASGGLSDWQLPFVHLIESDPSFPYGLKIFSDMWAPIFPSNAGTI